MKDKIKSLYNWYVEDGQYNGSEDEFRKSFFAPGQKGYEYRKSVFEHLRDNGDDVGVNYEEFAGLIGLRPKSSVVQKPKTSVSSSPATSSAPTVPSAPKVQDKSSLTTAASTAQASYNPAPSSAKPSSKPEPAESESNKESLFGRIRNKVNDVVEDPKAQLAAIRGLGNALMTAGNVNPAMALLGYGINDVAPNFTTKKEVVRDDEFEAKEKDYREKKAILEKEHKDAKRDIDAEYKDILDSLEQRDKAIDKSNEPTGVDALYRDKAQEDYWRREAAKSLMSRNNKDRLHQSRKALQTLEEAHIERNQKGSEGFIGAMGRRLKDFGEDIDDGDTSLFDFGVSEAKSYANVLSIVRKVNNGEELTPEEMKVMHVRALQQAVEDGHGDDIGYGYKAMGVTIESLPFMLEMAINPLSGFGKGMAKTAAGRLVKKGVSRAVNRTLGGYIGKKASVTAGRIATRVVGDAIGAAGMAATSGAARVAGDAERRMSGDVTYENADNGDVVYTGNVNQASAGTALFKAFGSVAIENHSEMLGDYFAPILGAVSRKAGNILDKVEVTGVGKKIHLKDARKFINDVKSSDVAKLIDDFQEQTHWDGVIGEYAEEVVGGIENALLVGDEKLTTDEGGVFNLERNIETFLGVGLMGGFMSAVKTLGYRTPHYRQMQDLKRQARDIENSVQNKEAWHEIRAGIDNESDEDTKAAITAALTDPSFSEDERRSILDYAKKSYQLRGSVAATASETEEKAAAGVADAQDDYNEGRTVAQSASPIDLYNAQREYDTAYEMMAVQLGDRMAEQVRGMEEEDLTEYVGEATGDNGWSEEDIFALNQYASAKARLDGINDSVSERVSERVEEAKSELGRRTGDDGSVTSVTLKVGDRQVYVTGGNLVTFDDGSINAQESSPEITVYDPTTGKTEMISPRDILSIDESVNADTEIATAAAAAEEEISAPVRQGMEGSIDITTGTTIPSMNGVITVGEEVLDDNGAPTGTYNVDVDGEAAVMSEDEMRSAYDELKARVDEERAVAAERGRSEREAARNEEEYRQQVRVGDDVTFVRDGKRISGRAVMDYDEDSLIVDVEEGARTRSYNVRREEIVAPGTAVEEEETPAVDDNAVQEDDVQTDTGYTPAHSQEQTETPGTTEETEAAETVAPAHADNGTTTSAPSTDEFAVGQETAAPAQTPAAQVHAEQQQQTPANRTTTAANGNVGTPAADTATMQRESGNATANVTATAANTPASAQDIVSDKNTPMPINEDTGEPDYARATPERTREYLYNEAGLEADEADAYVGNNAEQAREELEKAKESKPKMEKGKTLTQFLSEKAAWQQQMDEAQRNVDYWEGVKNARQQAAPGMAPAQDATQVAEPVAGGTEMQNVGQDTVAPSAPVAGNAVTGEAVQDAAMEKRDSLRKNSPVTGEQVEALAAAEAETNTEPTEAQKEAGNYKKGHVKIDGYDITIENPKGSVRSGTDADGKQWSVTMNNTYGYIRGTEGVDGDHIDIFLSDDPSTGNVFVIDQVNADGTFDEHKVMYGFASAEEARDNYLANYSEGWTGLGTISEVTKDEFKKWIGSSHRKTKPFADYKNVKVEGAQNEVAEVVEDKAKKRSMMERIAEKLGYRIEWHETMEQNGLFDPKTKTIHIALDAENPLAAVFGHESMHRIAENAEDYKSILALAKEVLGEEEFERRVDDAEKRYRDAGYDKPRSYYEEEAVCDFMGEMLDNDRLLERVCWDANHRVLAAIRNVIDRILAAIGMADARLMHVRLTVSAAYNNAIRRTETEGEVPTKEGELRASLLRKHDVDRMSSEYHSGKKTGITKKVFDAAQKAMDAMYDMMLPYYEATALGKRMLPEERYGRKGAASTIFSNGSYGKTMENTLKCIRTLAYNEFTDDVKRALGRPLTQKESFLASQMVYDISSDPQCLYCYVSLDRKAYDEFLLRYMQQRDGVLGKFREMDASKRAIGKTAPHTALPELYAEFLDKRKDTKQQQERFDMWIRNEIDGAETITAADLSTADVRSAVLEGLDASMARQVKDAEKYAQSASWAKKDVDYISYVGELLKLSPAWIKKLTGEYGLRFYSFSEYTPAFLLENMQMVRDAALRGLRGLGYTKELDFVKVFAPTGMNINCSCYGRMDSEGNMQMDTRQGADWEEVKRLRGQYRNVGAVFVATNDAAVEWALAQDWIDVVIPFHIVRTGQDIADFYGWSNYSKEQADSVVGSSKKMYISPVEHKNDKAAFLAACEKHGVTPRFAKWLDNPNYMKLVNETRLSVDESSDLQPVFDMDAAADSWKRFVNTGGYYNGWWNVDAEGYADAVRTVVEDIRSGKMANEVDYGRQDVPANVEKMVAAARKKRIHGNVPLVDVYDMSGNALSSGEQRASLRKQKAGSSASDATPKERALRDALNDVLTSAGIDVVTDIEEGQRVLDEVNGDEVREQKGYYDPRSSISPVRGKWTKEKIVRRLKDLRGAITGYKAAASRIAEFDSAEELAEHMFYHGTQFGGGSLKPSILMSDRDIERIGGGGYGDKYWGVSVSRRKDIASRFSSGRSVRIYPIILVKNAKVKEMPNLDDAADLEDYIVDLWKEGVDAVWIGDKNKGEQELCVLNPRAIVNIDTADTYDYFQLGTEENPLHVIDNDGIKKLYDDAVRYVNARRNTPKKPLLPSRFYPGKEGEILGERKSDDVYEREFAEYKRRLDEYNNSEEAKMLNDEEEYARRNIRFFRTADGNAYGFTVNGKVYIDPRMVNAETPIHEYTHLWATALRERKPKEWKNVVELMKGTDVWDEVVRTYPELKTDDEIADEVLAQYSGRRGAERLRQEMDAVLKSDSGITEKAAAVRAINNVRSALNSFWRSVARMLGLRYTSAEDVADCVMRDMLNLEKPGEMKPNWKMPARERLDYKSSDDELGYSLWAIKSGINPAKKYLMDFFLFPTEKYRTVFPTPTTEDYFLSTRTDFKTVPTDDVKGTWEEMKNSGKYEYTKSPLSNSEYLVDHETGDIYRMSDHWGPASSCYWTLDGFPGQRYTDETIAKSNIKDFDVWHNKKEKTVPREFHMREYALEVEQSITNYRDVLAKVPMTDAHRARFERGLAMLEDVQRRLEEGGYKPKKEDLKYQKNGDARMQVSIENLKDAESFIKTHLKQARNGQINIFVPEKVNRKVERIIGHKIKQHAIDIGGLNHGYNNHGENGKKIEEDDIPLTKEDLELIPSIMICPDNIIPGSENNGIKSVRYVKNLSNGRIIYIEAEGNLDGSVLVSKNVWAKTDPHKSPQKVVDARQNGAPKLTSNNVILKGDAAKIRKDAENAIREYKKLLEESKLADENAPVYREGESVDDSMTESESQEDYDLYRTVEDEDTIAFLEGQPSVTTYRSMALIDGKLYPPMSSKESGSKQLRNPSELGKWEEAEEAPDKAYKKGNRWYFDLKKDNGKTVAGVAYNPYIHTSTTMLNDQFSEAQERDNLVVVEMHVPESELTSGYKADKAKDSVGAKQWKAGIIQGMLSGTREVILTRWAKPVRIVPVEEVADHIVGLIEGKVEVMPTNVVTPQQREALEERGVEFVETDNKGKMSAGFHKGKTWSSVYGKKAKSARKKNDSPSRIRKAVETLCKKLNLDNVEILDDASGLEGKRKKAKGFYNRKTGKITIVLSNATSVSDAVQTLLHEAVAHYGLRKMFGAHFDTFLDNVFRSADENVRKKIAELSRKHGFDIRTATEEYLASLAEDTNFEKENSGWWNKVKALFADMLRNMGFENFGGITLSDNELRYILWRSYRNLAESGNGVFSTAEDTAKQSALNVGEFSAEDTADADLYRVGDDAMEEYHRQVNRSFMSKFREAWIDGMMSVKAAMDAISNELSERIEDFENPYLFENQMHGISRVQSEVFQRRYFEPMVRKFNAILNDYDLSEEDLYKYLMAKHGIERNYVFAMRDANRAFEEEQKKDPNTTKSVMDFYKPRDYSGLTSLMEENRVNVAENVAEAYVSVIESHCGRDLDELWDLINSCTKWTLRHSYECGELSRGQYENIRDMFKHYIPLRGWDGTNAQDVYDYIGSKSGVYSGMVKAKGRRSVADNPIAYIGNMAISQIISGNRNRLKQHAYRMAQNHPTSLFTVGEQWYENFGDEKNPKWMVVYPDIKESDAPDVVSQKFDDFYNRMKSLEAQHKAKRKRGHEQIEYPATNSQKHQHIVRCKMNGKEYVLYVNGNPRFAQAINGELTRQSAQESTETAKFFAGVSRWMANNFTSRNPSFIISNAARDMQMAMEMMGIKEGAAYQALLGKNMSKLLFPNLKKKGFAMMPDLMKKFEEGTLAARGVERYFKEFMERGGETGFTSLKDVEQMKLDIISLTRHDQQGRLNPSRALRALGDTFEYYNRCVEDMSRFAVYMTSRQRGKSIAQSIDDAKNCTLNFNRKGSGAMGNATFRHLYIFVNPAIQALSMLFESAKKHPFRLTATLAGNLIAGAVIPVVNTMCMAALGGDDDDYWNLPVWERRNNIVIWVPGTKRFVTIPLPQEMRCFYGLGEAAVSCMMGHGGEHPAMEVMEQFLDLLPISFTGAGGNMLVNLSPTMLQPLMQIYANTDFTGKPIFRDNEGSKYEPLFQKAYSGTPSWMVKTSKVINDLTGGDTHEQGWYEKTLFGKWANNPAIVNHLLKGYYGGVYSFISGTAGMLTTALGGEMPKTYEIPIVNRFIKDPTERKSAMLPEWYWDIVDERDRYRSEIRRWKDDAKKGDEHAYEKLVEKHQGIEYERYMMRDSYIKQIDEVRKYIKATDDEEEVKMAEEYVRGLSGQLRKLNNLDDEELEKVSRLPSSEFQYLMDMTPKEISKYLKKMPYANEEQQ